MPILEVEDLFLHYRTQKGPVKAVDEVTFDVEPGHTLAIVGESGCGKTSTASAILRLLPKNVARYEGRVSLDGTDIMALSDEEFRKDVRWQGISMVFQGAMNALNPTARVAKQVAEPLQIHLDAEDEEARARAREGLRSVGLPDYVEKSFPHELSGGMKQRVVIAMALILRPKLVILDEPTSALDVMTQANIINLLKRLKREEHLSYVFITHDLGLASELADEICIMYAGKALEIGPAERVYADPQHPYTEALLKSVPLLRSTESPISIPGSPPDLLEPPLACRFHPRCSVSFNECGWSAQEMADALERMSFESGGNGLSWRELRVENDQTLVVEPEDGADPNTLRREIERAVREESEAIRAFKAVQQLKVADGGVTITLHDVTDPWMIGEEHRAACLLLREGRKTSG
ncbi:MAG: ABC transporter ATP-binding protein [Thermoplasmata archaeon]